MADLDLKAIEKRWRNYHLTTNDVNSMISRIKELERDVREWEIVNKQWEKINTNLVEQNKRYREAIESVLEIENYGVAADYIKTVTNILLEALEDENG